MKKITLALLFSTLAFTTAQAVAADDLAAIKSSGTITFGTEGTYAPYTFHDESDKLVGLFLSNTFQESYQCRHGCN